MNNPSIRITLDKNDRDSIYYPDLVGAQLGIKESKENLKKTLDNINLQNKEIDELVKSISDILNSYFEVKP